METEFSKTAVADNKGKIKYLDITISSRQYYSVVAHGKVLSPQQ